MKLRIPILVSILALAGSAIYGADAPAQPKPMDFSTAGYAGGGVALPDVAAKLVVAPSGGDDTHLVQAAIDTVAKLPLDGQGFRGAVLLRAGTFRIEGQLRIETSGVVLRGDGATLVATGQGR